MSPELLPASADGLGVRACIAEQSLRRHGSGVSVETAQMRRFSKLQTEVIKVIKRSHEGAYMDV